MHKWEKGQKYGRIGKLALTEPEVEQLLNSITNLDDEALLRLAIATGMRRSDVVSIELANINDSDDLLSISFYEQKKNRTWIVNVGGETRKVLLQHINKLPKGSSFLFPAKNHKKHICSKTAYNLLQKWLGRAGLSPRPFHALRSTCIKLAKKRGWDMESVKALTGDSERIIRLHYEVPSDNEMKDISKNKPIL